jgi:OmpA-OmpF porin, OOP family
MRRLISLALLALLSLPALAIDKVPTKDLPKFQDLPSIKRFADSVLVFRDDVAYDEVAFPTGKVTYADGKITVAKTLAKAGQRSMLVYVAPTGRSPLEVLRNYQADLKSTGFAPVFECEGEACGMESTLSDGNNFGFGNTLFKDASFSTERGTAHACAGGAQITGLRYAMANNAATGETVAVLTWRPLVKGYAYSCPDAQENHTSVMVFRVQAKAMEQKMTTVSASEMTTQLTANGKVAIYGILFDSGKADIKPESKASLDEIGKLMKASPALKLHVVGHTDNAGGLEGNFDLSKRRAGAVKDTLVKQYGIAADRLTANGVSYLAPVSTNGTDAGRAKNRRVELVLF